MTTPTRPPWLDEGRHPDALELRIWLEGVTDDHVAEEYLARLLAAAHRGAVCEQAEHSAQTRQLEHEAARARRYRLAWVHARTRAMVTRLLLDQYADRDTPVPLTLVLDEEAETVRWDQPGDPATDLEEAADPRHALDLRPPSILTGTDAGGRPLFSSTRPWWLCHRTGLIHTEGPCILRTNPLDLREGQGPIDLTPEVRTNLEERNATPAHIVTIREV